MPGRRVSSIRRTNDSVVERAGVGRRGMGVAALLLAAARPAAADPLSLAAALERARTGSPVLRVAEAEVAGARGRLRQARLIQANPVVSADLARHTAPPARDAGGEDALDRGVEIDQEVEIGGQRGLRIAAAGHDVAHAE